MSDLRPLTDFYIRMCVPFPPTQVVGMLSVIKDDTNKEIKVETDTEDRAVHGAERSPSVSTKRYKKHHSPGVHVPAILTYTYMIRYILYMIITICHISGVWLRTS